MNTYFIRRFVLCTLAWLLPAAIAWAQSIYPSKPIRIIVPYAAGGATDFFGRVVAEKLAARLGQPVLVESKPGAGGTLAADYVAKAPADGYTLLVADTGPNAIAAGLYPKLSYDPIGDLSPIAMAVYLPIMLAANNDLPVRNVKELVDYAKVNPGKLNYGSSGNGNIGHLAGEYLKLQANISLIHVPYKGAIPSITDTISGQVQLVFVSAISANTFVKAGRLRPLAATGSKRSALLPSLPTVSESGYPNYDVGSWGGFLAPAGTPKEIVTRLNAEIVAILNTSEVRDKLTNAGFDVATGSPDEFANFIRSEVLKWKQIVRATNAKPD